MATLRIPYSSSMFQQCPLPGLPAPVHPAADWTCGFSPGVTTDRHKPKVPSEHGKLGTMAQAQLLSAHSIEAWLRPVRTQGPSANTSDT